jgi:hypothetical protein
VTRLNAALYSFGADLATGRIVDQTANLLGPGFICGAPAPTGDLDAFAYTTLPGTSTVEATGLCGLQPTPAQTGALLVNCRLQPSPGQAGITGGLITSNSVVNQVERDGGAPTGSVWTAYVQGRRRGPATPAPVPGAPTDEETPGVDFYVVRTTNEVDAEDCREADLTSVQPDPVTDLVPKRPGPIVGQLRRCGDQTTMTVTAKGGPFTISAAGPCRTVAEREACSQTVTGATAGEVTGGLLTNNGDLWTVALFGAPEAAALSEPARLRVRRDGPVVRWRPRAKSGEAATYDVEVRRAGAWRRRLSQTKRTMLRARRTVRVRALTINDTPGRWFKVGAGRR